MGSDPFTFFASGLGGLIPYLGRRTKTKKNIQRKINNKSITKKNFCLFFMFVIPKNQTLMGIRSLWVAACPHKVPGTYFSFSFKSRLMTITFAKRLKIQGVPILGQTPFLYFLYFSLPFL